MAVQVYVNNFLGKIRYNMINRCIFCVTREYGIKLHTRGNTDRCSRLRKSGLTDLQQQCQHKITTGAFPQHDNIFGSIFLNQLFIYGKTVLRCGRKGMLRRQAIFNCQYIILEFVCNVTCKGAPCFHTANHKATAVNIEYYFVSHSTDTPFTVSAVINTDFGACANLFCCSSVALAAG